MIRIRPQAGYQREVLGPVRKRRLGPMDGALTEIAACFTGSVLVGVAALVSPLAVVPAIGGALFVAGIAYNARRSR